MDENKALYLSRKTGIAYGKIKPYEKPLKHYTKNQHCIANVFDVLIFHQLT